MTDEGFDYVIVGAGSAGCVLAARLSEDADVTVLLLEAGGPDRSDLLHLPAAFTMTLRGPYDWGYATQPQRHLHDRRLAWPRGKVLGGSSSINAMIYVRGNRADYDSWRDEHGCTGWGYADLLPYFRRAEDNAWGPSYYHGAGGPLRVADLRRPHPMSRAFVAAAGLYGLPETDVNGAHQDGAALYQVTQRHGRRWSAADAYLRPASRRANLTVRTDALVHRVMVRGGRAVGVSYEHDAQLRAAWADAEVIVCGGAVNSPQTLLLSGIGPADHLRAHGIDVLADVAGVGANLQDHPIVWSVWRTHGMRDLFAAQTSTQILRWALSGRGPLTTNGAEAGAFWRSDPALPAPDIQWHVVPASFVDHGLGEPQRDGFSIGTTLVSVASRGSVRLLSADPRWAPAIDPGYLSVEPDLTALVAGMRAGREIATQPPLARHLVTERDPGGDVVTDAALREHVRVRAETLYHPTSTCAMGSVVDTSLRVLGIDCLRVVDASVMPTVPRGNTNAPTIAIAERAADLIRAAR